MSNTRQKQLAAKTPEAWLADIEALPKKMRVPIANIVYWDYFGDMPASERWPHLDEYIKPVPEGVTPPPWPAPEILADALVMVGYDPHLACMRARTNAEEGRNYDRIAAGGRNYDRIAAGGIPKTNHHARQSIDTKVRKNWPKYEDPYLNVNVVRIACDAYFERKGLKMGAFCFGKGTE